MGTPYSQASWIMILTIILLAGYSLALPTPEAEEKDGALSRKILGSSVVTSVSVIMDVGNGSQTYFSDAVGKPMTKPSAATQLASPINLLNPDRYEFYTFDDSGDLVKRLMTLDEIQGIIASGDGESSNYNSQSLAGDEPEKKVDDIVNNVQNVLKGEMEAHKTSESKPVFDTPDVTSTWNMILPAIFGNSGENIALDKQQNVVTAETIMIEPTTLLPIINNTNVSAEAAEDTKQSTNIFSMTTPDMTTQDSLKQTSTGSSQTEELDTPIITVEINSNESMVHDEAPANSKTESGIETTASSLRDTPSTASDSTLASSETESFTSRPVIIISTPSPFTNKMETLFPSAIPPLSAILINSPLSYTTPKPSPEPTTIPPSAMPTIALSSAPSPSSTRSPSTIPSTPLPSTTSVFSPTFAKPQNEVTTPHGQLSTFFLVEDYKSRTESTTNLYSTPAPFSLAKWTTIENNIYQVPENTTIVQRPSPFTETKSTSTENQLKTTKLSPTETYMSTTEDITKANNKGYLNIDNFGNVQKTPSTRRTTISTNKPYPTIAMTSTENTIINSTEEPTTITPQPYLPTSTAKIFNYEEDVRLSTTADDLLPQSTSESANKPSTDKETQQTERSPTENFWDTEFTKLYESPTEKYDYTEKQTVTELLSQSLLTTNVYQLNPEILADETTLENFQPTTEALTTTDKGSTTEQINRSTQVTNTNTVPNSTIKPANDILTTAEPNLVSSIEQLLSQAIGNPEQSIENTKEGEKINQVIQNTNSRPMSEVQIETATAASALIGTPNTETALNVTLEDNNMNQAVDSLISQIIYHQPIQTTEGFLTTDNIEKYTERTTISISNESSTTVDIGSNNDINRYEEIDLEDLESSTISNSESKTSQPILLLDNERESSYTTENPEKTTSNENQILEQSTVDKGISSTELNQEESKYQSTLYSDIYGTTEKLVQDYTLSTQYNEGLSKPPYKVFSNTDLNLETKNKNGTDKDNPISKESLSKNNEILRGEASEWTKEAENETTSNITTEDLPTSTETFKDMTSEKKEILKSQASVLNRESDNENNSESFLIVASSSEYPDYASTENVDVVTENLGYDSTTSAEIYNNTKRATDSVQFTTQNLLTAFNNTEMYTSQNYPTTEVNSITDPQTQTVQENLQIKYQTTDINLVSETSKSTTDDLRSTQTPTEKINFPTTEQVDSITATQQPFIFSSTLQPFEIPTTYRPVTSTIQQKFNTSSSQRPFTQSTTYEPFTTPTSQPLYTDDLTQEPITVSTPQRQTMSTNTAEQSISSTVKAPIPASPVTATFVNLPTVTVAPKIEKPAELKLIQNVTSSTTVKPDMTWTLVSTVVPHKSVLSDETKTQTPLRQEPTSVDLVPKPLQGFGLEDSTSPLDTDVFQFTELCNELAFSFWSSVTSGISFARSVIVSPFAATSMLAMVFLGARGSTSGEMNEILKLDDMVTFNPHSIFKNVIESIEVSKKSGVAVSVFVKELYSDKNKGKLLSFYKERVKQFYDGHAEEANFREINDVIRRRTNLLVKRQTWGKIPEYLKDNNLFARPPLAAVSANIFQTDCSEASTQGRDGELHFVVLPSIRQRKLVPIPAVVWRSGFLAGYDPGLDATAVAIGTKDQTISTIFVIPGQQGISAPGDGLMRLEARLVESAFRQGGWSRLLRSLIPRPGLEVQIPRFSHKSVINATMALQRMGLKDLFNSNTADLKGLNGVAHELYLSDIVQVNTFATCGEGRIDETHHSEVYPATTNRSFRRIRKIQHYHSDKPYENSDILEEPRDYQRAFHDPLYDPSYLSLPLQLRPRQARLPEAPRLRFDRPFLYFVRHNPTGLILHMGRFNPRLLP